MLLEPIEKLDEKKLRGGYYTPKEITHFVCRWAIDHPKKRVLEPSCGDGNFIEASIQRFRKLGVPESQLNGLIRGIELIPQEAQKATDRAAIAGVNSHSIINTDFFEYFTKNPQERFDVIVGNPPFIRYQNFPESHRTLAIQMMKKLGLHPNKLTNIWVPFLVVSASLLSDEGKLGMVIPAELFQVKYAAETRIFLSNFFSRITIIAFNKLVFPGIQQEVVLLLCERKSNSHDGIRVVEIRSAQELAHLDTREFKNIEIKSIDHTHEKWTKYFLNEDEIVLLRKLKADRRLHICNDLMEVDVGIVTGRNKFFMLNEQQVDYWGLTPYTQRVVSRSNYLQGLTFNEHDFHINSKAGHAIYLFLPPNQKFDELPQACQKYITFGEEKEYHTGYKCRIRKRWYITPSLWNADAFALRQVSRHPKLIFNEIDASSTDTIHRVRFKNRDKAELIVLSFLNSLTFAFSEIMGRSYGGGVLTFEPTEVEELPIPLFKEEMIDYHEIDHLLREKKIETVLDIVDKELLVNQLGFSEIDVKKLRGIWRKLSDRRVNRNRKRR
jgi:adenine-specific DNA-methyltransferase